MLIRYATISDATTIKNFIFQLAQYEKLEHECVITEEKIVETLFCEHPKAKVIIAEVNHTPVGFALFFENYSTFLGKGGIYLEDLFVLPEYRAQGFGKALLKFIANVAVSQKAGRFEWSVLDWNTPAIKFYESIGAIPMSEWTVYRLSGESLKNFAHS